MKKFNVGCIGCGGISASHIDALLKNETVNIKYVCDIKEEKAKAAAEKTGARINGFDAIINDPVIDSVHIMTPHYLHAQMAISAMKAGKHVFLEKPMATSLKDAEEIIKTSEATGKKLSVCFQNRYNEMSVKMKEIINSPEAGKILGARAFVTWKREVPYYRDSGWRGTWATEGGGVLINQSIHTIDLLVWLLGEVESVRGNAATLVLQDSIEVEDSAQAVIFFKGGHRACFYATTGFVKDSEVFVEVVCENLSLRVEGNLTVSYKDGKKEVFSPSSVATGEKAYWGNSHRVIIDDFYKKISEGKDIFIDGREGIKALKVISGIYNTKNNLEPKIWK